MRQLTYRVIKNLTIFRLVLSLIFITTPIHAQASVFSFVSDFFNDGKSAFQDSSNNSQNMALLQATVNQDPNPSKGGGDISIVGDVALLSEVGPSGSMADIGEQTTSDKISVYVVREGDSLSQIAKMFDVSTNTIIWANDLHKSVIKPGQTLVILPVSGVRHSVAKGETLSTIAKKYGGDLDEILAFNDLSSGANLSVGDVVIIPDGEVGAYNYGSSSNKTSSSSSSSVAREAGGPLYKDYFMIPVNGKRSQGLHGYNAIDIAAPIGTPIVASASGKVIISKNSGWNGGYGNYMVIKHDNGAQTLYGHASQNIVYTGQNVVKGQIIGYVGNTGKSTGPHVHFEIRGAKNPF